MTTQVNSDKTVTVDARVKQFVEDEANRILKNVIARLTRVEVHLSDVNSRKSGPADKRCVVEARPVGAAPLSTTATADNVPTAVVRALRKMQRSLISFFGRHGRAGARRPRATAKTTAPKTAAPKSAAKKVGAAKKAVAKKVATPKKRAGAKTAAAETSTGRTPKKKPIFQARRKAWPAR